MANLAPELDEVTETGTIVGEAICQDHDCLAETARRAKSH